MHIYVHFGDFWGCCYKVCFDFKTLEPKLRHRGRESLLETGTCGVVASGDAKVFGSGHKLHSRLLRTANTICQSFYDCVSIVSEAVGGSCQLTLPQFEPAVSTM